MAILKNTTINDTSSITLPTQSVSTAAGLSKLRYNTTTPGNPSTGGATGSLEFYDGSAWRPVTGYSAGIAGTGGTISYIPGGGIVHTFTTTGAFTFTPAFSGTVQVLVVGGGGSSGYDWAGGGGGGSVQFNRNFPVSNGVGISGTVGAGGAGRSPQVAGPNGGNSTFSTITAQGGGGGGSWTHSSPGTIGTTTAGRSGASGGGGSNTGDGIDSRTRSTGGFGAAGEGYPGGSGLRFNVDTENTHQGGGGGGAGGPGASAPDGRQNYRGAFRSNQITGGPGRASDILGGVLYYGGGGGGGDIWAGDLLTVVLVAEEAAVIITAARTAALLKTVQAEATHLLKGKQVSQQHEVDTAELIQVAVQVADNMAQTAELAL